MKTINSIAVFDNDQYLLAMLKGYCYANHITKTKVDFNMGGIKELEKIKPALIVVSFDLVSAANKSFETGFLRLVSARDQIKICGFKKPTDIISAEVSEWIDVIINNPLDIGEIDWYLKKNFLLDGCLTERRRLKDRRTFQTEEMPNTLMMVMMGIK